MRQQLKARRMTFVAAGIALATLLAGCSNDTLEQPNDPGYISGDGSLKTFEIADRGDAVSFESETTDGDAVSSDDYVGEVLVVNFWYAACAPCRAEAPDLKKLSDQFADQGASFLGVNVRDQAASAVAFNETYSITYPSVMDADGGMQLAFSGSIPPNAVPTTLVLDSSGRVAARILGQVNSPSILETLIKDTIAEDG